MTSSCRLNHLSVDDETSDVLKRPVKMFAHVLALCFILSLFKLLQVIQIILFLLLFI